MPKSPSETKPAIFWHSDPVFPDETVMLSGAGFNDKTKVELSATPNSPVDEIATPSADKTEKRRWIEIPVCQVTNCSLKFVIPASLELGVYTIRVSNKNATSKLRHLNAPDTWWIQGDMGLNRVTAGGTIRILGKALSFGSGSSMALINESTIKPVIHKIKATDASTYNLSFKLPYEIIPSQYTVMVHNGLGDSSSWSEAGIIEVIAADTEEKAICDVLDFGADPDGMNDSTHAIVLGLERLRNLGGGVLYFPRGRYRIDSGLRSGLKIESPIIIPNNVTLRGEGMGLVSLWWPDRELPLPTLIEGGSDFCVEDLSIYVQGPHRTIISGENNARISRVRIRANCYYMCGKNGKAHHNRGFEDPGCGGGYAINLYGDNVQVNDCDIYHSAVGIYLDSVRGGIVSGNTVSAANFAYISGGPGIIFEHNKFTGNQLATGGSNIALYGATTCCENVYFAHNSISHQYGGDHEMLTFDGHGTAYLGGVKNAQNLSVDLEKDIFLRVLGKGLKDAMFDIRNAVIYILSGTGAGQYRRIKSREGTKIEITQNWDVTPDSSSIVSIGGFNGRHLIIENSGQDVGPLQLYPPNCECIIAGNRLTHAGNINSLSRLGYVKDNPHQRIEPSWYNQFLDNHIIMGNGWGGGSSTVNRWLGGEGTLLVWGSQVVTIWDGGRTDEKIISLEDLKALFECKLPHANKSIALSAYQVIRRHIIDNNSSIRVKGSVRDVIIEKCKVQKAKYGIRIDAEVEWDLPKDIGQLTSEPEPSEQFPVVPYLSPEFVYVRNNHFNDVDIEISGSAIKSLSVCVASSRLECDSEK